jgi:hypothetical protein
MDFRKRYSYVAQRVPIYNLLPDRSVGRAYHLYIASEQEIRTWADRDSCLCRVVVPLKPSRILRNGHLHCVTNALHASRPDEPDYARDDASQKSQAALQHFQHHAEGRGKQCPLKNAPLAIPRCLKAIIQCGVAACEAMRC